MWSKIIKYLADFPTAVLTGIDHSGYPFSFRCKPDPINHLQVLHVEVPAYADIQPGPAGLLCHKHDDQLWNLESFIVRGSLERDGEDWLFRPIKFIQGAGIGGMIGMVNFLRSGRRTAQQYLDKRGLTRPKIEWEKVHEVWAELKHDKPRN